MVEVDLKRLVGRLNRYCTRALEGAAGNCVSRTNYEVTVEHLLQALMDDPNGDIQQAMQKFEIDPGRVNKMLIRDLDTLKTGNAGRPVFSPLLTTWFQNAWLIASIDHGLAEVRGANMLEALLSNPARLASGEYIDELSKIPVAELSKNFDEITSNSRESAGLAGSAPSGDPGAGAGAEPSREGTALQRFCQNFCERARNGELDPVFGRDREIRQMIDILARRRKNNPICVGEPGVGKSAVVEGLAMRIVEGDVPEVLQNVDVIGLDVGLLQAGASVKGEFEKRLKGVIDEIKASPKPLVLFIDEAHTLIGAGGAAGTGDAGQLLKPALARGELRTVAATTWTEYKKYFEKDAALARRFQLVKLDEPGPELTATMLRGLRANYEKAHKVVIRDEALVAAAELGSRYIAGRQQPDKGIDLVDTAAARVKVAFISKPAELQDLERSIETDQRTVNALKRDAETGGHADGDTVAELEARIGETAKQAEEVKKRWMKEREQAHKVVAIRNKLNDLDNPDGGDTAEQEPGAPATGGKAAPEGKSGKEETNAPKANDVKEPEFNLPDDKAELKKLFETELAKLREMQGKDPLVPVEVTSDVVAKVVGDWTGIPVGNMVKDQATQLLTMEDELTKRVKGQDHVMQAIATGIRASKAGLGNPDAPMGVFLFVGPSGVGKTETALAVADLLFGGERFMTAVNMSEYQEKHTVSRLIGSPPGYVGYGEGGQLTEAVRQRPYSVVLLDEVEKADLEVMNLFYQVFDKGVLNDGEGREIDFRNTVMFLTSNLATDIITEACSDGDRPDMDELVNLIRPQLSAHFKPALLARMSILPFYTIDEGAMKMITGLKLNKLVRQMRDTHGMALDFKSEVTDTIAARCTEVETGARNIDHIIRGTLLPQMSTQLLQKMSEGDLPSEMKVGIGESGDFNFEFAG